MQQTSTRNNINRNEQLCIDHVLSSQPELGPTIPDGGYGWVILLASSFFQIVIPCLPVGFGIITLFSRIENAMPTTPSLWDINTAYAPMFFIIVWTFTEAWCRKLVYDSTWPRLVAVAATCLTSAGLLIMWLAINKKNNATLHIIAGSVSGLGASIILTQTDAIISDYFHRKLKIVKALLTIFAALGFVITPMILGHSIFRIGILQSISWYQAIILQGIVISIVFKKPEYLKQHRSRYKLLRGIADEEEDIFTKNTTELQSPRTSMNNSNASSTNNKEPKNDAQPQSLQEELRQAGWGSANEDTNITSNNKHTKLNAAFAVESHNTTSKSDGFEDNFIDTPQPLFSESYLNNNVSYSYDSAPTEVDNPVVFMPIPSSFPKHKWAMDISFLKEPTFYKTLFFFITLKYSVFLFWTIFPSYLYIKVDHLKVHHTAITVGCIAITGLMFATVITWVKIDTKVCNVLVSVFSWISAAGCFILSDSTSKLLIVSAAITIIININSLQILATPLMKYNFPGEQSSGHIFLSTVTTVSLFALLGIDASYKNCFRILAILHLLAGSLCFTNVIYKAIKNYMK